MTDEEKTIAIRMSEKGDCVKEIMQALQRSGTTIRQAIKPLQVVRKRGTRGRPPKWAKRMVKRVIWKDFKDDKYASDISTEFEAPVTVRRVQQILHVSK